VSGWEAEPFDGFTSRLLRRWLQPSSGFDVRGGVILGPSSGLGRGLLTSAQNNFFGL
jgi:hypothetical protein